MILIVLLRVFLQSDSKFREGCFVNLKAVSGIFFPPSRQLSLRAGSVINWITFLNIVIIKKLQH